MRLLLTHILLFGIHGLVLSQESWTWEQCIEFALANNYDIRIIDINRQQQQYNLKDAKNSFLPGVSGSVSLSESAGNSIDPSTNIITNSDFYKNSYSIGGSITLFQGFSRNNRLKFEKYNLQYSEKEVEAQQNAVAFNVLEMYINVLFYKGMKDIANEQAQISRQALMRNIKMYELGRIPESEVIELEAQLANDSLNAIQVENMYLLNLLELKNTMNYPIFDTLKLEKINISEMLITDLNYSVEDIMQSAKSNLPQIQNLDYTLKAAQYKLAEIKGYALPSLSLGSSWGSTYSSTTRDDNNNITSFPNQIRGKTGTSICLSLSIPLFSRLSNYSSIKKASLSYELAQVQYEKELIENEYIIYNNIRELDAAKKVYQASNKNQEKQELAFITANKKLDKGIIDLIDYNTVKNIYAGAKTEFLRSELELFLKAKTIQFYLTGKIL